MTRDFATILPSDVRIVDPAVSDIGFNNFGGLQVVLDALNNWAKDDWVFVDVADRAYWKNSPSTVVVALHRDAIADSRGLGGFMIGRSLGCLSPDEFDCVTLDSNDWLVVRLWWD